MVSTFYKIGKLSLRIVCVGEFVLLQYTLWLYALPARPCFFMCLYGVCASAYMHTYVHTYTYNLHVGSDTLVSYSEAPCI